MFLSFFSWQLLWKTNSSWVVSTVSPCPSRLPLSAGLTQPPPSRAGIPSLPGPHVGCSQCREADFFSSVHASRPLWPSWSRPQTVCVSSLFSEQPAPATTREGAVVLCLQCVPRLTLQGCRPVAACCLWRHGTDTGREVALKKCPGIVSDKKMLKVQRKGRAFWGSSDRGALAERVRQQTQSSIPVCVAAYVSCLWVCVFFRL